MNGLGKRECENQPSIKTKEILVCCHFERCCFCSWSYCGMADRN